MIFRNVEAKISIRKKTFFLKRNFLRHISCLKSTKMHFYGNPTTDFVTRLPYIALGNLPKIRKIPMFWDILWWVQSYADFSAYNFELREIYAEKIWDFREKCSKKWNFSAKMERICDLAR